MATILNNNYASLADLVKASNFDGNMKKLLGEMAMEDSFMAACPWFETNDGMRHKNMKASKLGKGEFVAVNQGRGTTSSDFQLSEENICYYSVISKVDDSVLQAGTSEQAVKLRTSQDKLNLTGFMQDFQKQIFYSKMSSDSKSFNGLAERRSVKSSKYFHDGGKKTGGATSMYLVQFGEDGMNMKHQPGHVGFETKDRGMKSYERTINGSLRTVDMWEMEYNIWSLLDLFDERCLIRYGNLDPIGATNGIDPEEIVRMKNQLPVMGKGAAAYVNRSLITQAELVLLRKDNVMYTRDNIENFGPVIKIMGVPMFLQDCISDKEEIVS